MTELNIAIEELISQNSSDFEIAKLFKIYFKEYLTSLETIFNDTQGKDFFVKHTKKIDEFITLLYKYLIRKHFGNYLPMSNSIPISLIALGSYGREQLCVYSDIDIMVLYQDIQGYNLKPIIEELMILAWDSGLKLGSRVHEISKIEDEVKNDITIKTSILESRLIYGSKILWYRFQNNLKNIQNYNQKEFIIAKLEEHKIRLAKYPLRMQPNIKDGYGGMRESNMLFWIANVIYGISSSKDLIGITFTDEEYKIYRSSLEYIFRIRNALHLIAKKKLDIVTFDILPELSSKLGFKDTVRLTKERQCMSKLLESLHIIHSFSANIINKIIRPYLFDKNNIKLFRNNRIFNKVYICNNTLYTSYKRQSITLVELLKELNLLPIDIIKVDSSYIYFMQKTIIPKKITKKIKTEIKLLFDNSNIAFLMMLIYNAGLFQIILPSAKKIINQPQFDGYHIHPVDIHTLEALKFVHNIKDKFIKDIYDSLTKHQKSLLSIVTLLHDIGKGRGKDHHIVGENIFRKFARSFEFSEVDISLCCRIIRYHNMANKVATNEDIYAQKVILSFTGLVQTKETLDLLMCLTYADINSVDTKVYTSNRSKLLQELYLQSLPAFDNKEILKDSTRRVQKENTIKKLKSFTSLSRLMQRKILNIESNQLFLIYKASDIIQLALDAKNVDTIEYSIQNDEHLIIKIIRVVPINLGYLLGKLSFLSISGMKIFKLYDEKKYFEIEFSQNIDNEDLLFIEQIIKDSLNMDKTFKYKKPQISKNEIIIDCEHTEQTAQIKIQTKDQKGLFAYIAYIFDKYNIDIQSAKIHSHRGKVNDLLLVEKNGYFCKNKKIIIENIIN